MPTNLHIRDVPDEIHATLIHRAAARGKSLRQYTIEVLQEHCALPTMEEWLAGLSRLPPAAAEGGGAEAVRRAREEDDEAVSGRHGLAQAGEVALGRGGG